VICTRNGIFWVIIDVGWNNLDWIKLPGSPFEIPITFDRSLHHGATSATHIKKKYLFTFTIIIISHYQANSLIIMPLDDKYTNSSHGDNEEFWSGIKTSHAPQVSQQTDRRGRMGRILVLWQKNQTKAVPAAMMKSHAHSVLGFTNSCYLPKLLCRCIYCNPQWATYEKAEWFWYDVTLNKISELHPEHIPIKKNHDMKSFCNCWKLCHQCVTVLLVSSSTRGRY